MAGIEQRITPEQQSAIEALANASPQERRAIILEGIRRAAVKHYSLDGLTPDEQAAKVAGYVAEVDATFCILDVNTGQMHGFSGFGTDAHSLAAMGGMSTLEESGTDL